MFKTIVGAMFGQKILVTLGMLLFVFIGLPLIIRHEKRSGLLNHDRKVCPYCGQRIHEGILRK